MVAMFVFPLGPQFAKHINSKGICLSWIVTLVGLIETETFCSDS